MITPTDAARPPSSTSVGINEVQLIRLRPRGDDRGTFTELFRRSWPTDIDPVQWNLVQSAAGVLRGVHLHHRHHDYLTLVAGRAHIGLIDLRPGSPTEGTRASVLLDGHAPRALTIPPGVAHGFCFLTDAAHVYAVSHEWDLGDELGCRWDDPDLGLTWPLEPRVSPRDAALGTLEQLRQAYRDATA